MVQNKKDKRELISHLGLARIAEAKPIANTVKMTIEFMRYQGEVAYAIAKKQAIATASSASTIGFGWSAFFFGILQESWLTSSLGLMLVFAGTYVLAYWTPRVLDKVRARLADSRAEEFYSKWLPEQAKLSSPEELQEAV